MLCPYCHQPLAPTDTVCPGCGNAPHPFAAPQSGPSPPPASYPLPPGAVPNYLVQSILCTLFCSLPLGAVAIVFSVLSDTRSRAGDYAGAMEHARLARIFCWISFGLGLVPVVLVLGYMAVVATVMAASQM